MIASVPASAPTVPPLTGASRGVNNAGIQRRVPLLAVTLAVRDEALRNNMTSALLTSRAVAPQMIGRGGGKIICTLSLMSDLGRRNTRPYTA